MSSDLRLKAYQRGAELRSDEWLRKHIDALYRFEDFQCCGHYPLWYRAPNRVSLAWESLTMPSTFWAKPSEMTIQRMDFRTFSCIVKSFVLLNMYLSYTKELSLCIRILKFFLCAFPSLFKHFSFTRTSLISYPQLTETSKLRDKIICRRKEKKNSLFSSHSKWERKLIKNLVCELFHSTIIPLILL